MNRIIYAALILVALTTGCTKSNLVDVPKIQNSPISFDTYNGRTPVTRSAEVTQANIGDCGFHVTAFNNPLGTYNYSSEYLDRDVVWSAAEKAWTYSPLVYWPGTGTLQFVAYGSNIHTGSTGEGVLIPDKDLPFTMFTYTVPETAADHKDLIVCTKDQSVIEGAQVTFTMKHFLSRVGFKLKTIGSGASVKINNIALYGGFAKTGALDLINSQKITPVQDAVTTSYKLFTDNQSFTTTQGDAVIAIFDNSTLTKESTEDEISAAQADRYMMIIPGDVTDYDWASASDIMIDIPAAIGNKPFLYVDYELAGVRKEACLSLEENRIFSAGVAYEFIFEISISEIKFTGTVVDWDEDLDGDKTEDSDDDGDPEKDDDIYL